MPGWGESDTPTDEQGRDQTAQLIAFLDELGIERAALVGNSMGGGVPLQTAISHPERVSHLITMGSPAPGANIFAAGDGPTEGLKVLLAAYKDPSPQMMKALVQIFCFNGTWQPTNLPICVRPRRTPTQSVWTRGITSSRSRSTKTTCSVRSTRLPRAIYGRS